MSFRMSRMSSACHLVTGVHAPLIFGGLIFGASQGSAAWLSAIFDSIDFCPLFQYNYGFR